jgi:hypothetical protein
MTNEEKAVIQLGRLGVTAEEDNETVYVHVNDTMLEISEYEINFQAKRYDEEEEDNS